MTQQADTLFTNALVLTMDENFTQYNPGAVAVKDDKIIAVGIQVEREFVSPDFVRLGTLIACAEQIRSGVTTFNDMYYFEEDVAKATAEVGMRAVCGQTVMKFPAPDATSFEDSLQMARDFIQRWKDHPLIVQIGRASCR